MAGFQVSTEDRGTSVRFGTPKDRLPPFGAVAKQWYRDPTAWMWIGWRQWHSGFTDVSYQEFEKGLIIGPLKFHELNHKGRIFIGLRDGRWFSELSQEGPAATADWWSEQLEAYRKQKPGALRAVQSLDPQVLAPSPLTVGLADSLSSQFLRAREGTIPVQIRAYREGLVIGVTQIQDNEKALPAWIVVLDIRKFDDGKLITTRLLHSDSGRFNYDAIQLERAPRSEGDLHYGEEGVWWIVGPSRGKQYLRMFWPDRPPPRHIELPPGKWVAELKIWVGNRYIPLQAAWHIDSEQRVTISEIDPRS
jgi:hypothetical protein